LPETVRIKDIARQLGVSAATVSRALNDKPGVGTDTRRRVLQAAADLEFAPNAAARSLHRGHTGIAAFVVREHEMPFSSDPFYFAIVRGMERALAEEGHHLMLTILRGRDGEGTSGLRVVRERRADGLVLAGPDIDPALVISAAQYGLPVVLVDNALDRTPIDAVLCDNFEGARSATDHLISHGHTRVAFAGGPPHWFSTRERQAGYEHAMREAQLQPVIVHEAATTAATGAAAGQELLTRTPRPTAVFAVNDAMALGVIRAARGAGLRVPQDLAVAGFDDIAMAEMSDPPLTTVHVDKELMGRVAARQLLELIKSGRRTATRTVVATALVVRASCGCAMR
jgi:LacI family transcriptional regulator